MSKSLGNVVKIRDALRSSNSDSIRMYFLEHHYRESFDFDLKAIQKPSPELEQILQASKLVPKKSHTDKLGKSLGGNEKLSAFRAAMDDNLDTPKALSLLVKISEEIIEKFGTRKNTENDTQNEPIPDDFISIFWFMIETLGFQLL